LNLESKALNLNKPQKMKTKIFLLIFSLLSILIVSCTEKIDIQLDDSYTRLVVDGSITTDTMSHTVVLSSTSSYFYNQPAPAVTGATVSISDGTKVFELTEAAPGTYNTAPDVFGEPGKVYTLNIKLANAIGGHSDYTATSLLNPVTTMDSVTLLFHPEWSKKGIWEVKCYVKEPPTVDFYRFLLSKNQTMFTDTLDEWIITDDIFFNGNYTNGLPIGYLDQGSTEQGLRAGDTITAEVNSIGKEYFNFLTEAQSELFGSNPLFSGPPANIKGNISNGGIGFFTAYSATRSFAIAPEVGK
jgi:hypothetical protein